MRCRIGGLFYGYGGLDMAVQQVLGGDLAWVSEIDKGACKLIAHRHPDVPNHGDITSIDWSQVEPVDILTGGSPCQDLSHAGKRAGMTDGTRSNLWVAMREAIAQLRPGLVIWENVRGAYSAEADSQLVTDTRLLAGTRRRDGRPVLRALGRVLGDLAELGYDAVWHGLRAADVGAPHGRFRVFLVAYPADAAGNGWHQGWSESARLVGGHDAAVGSLLPTPAAYDGDRGGPQDPDKRKAGGHSVTLQDAVHGLSLLPTPAARDFKGVGPADMNRHSPNMSAIAALLPTPAVNDMGEGKTVEAWDEWTAAMQAKHGNGNGHGKSLSIEAQRLLPTPTSMDAHASGGGYNGQSNVTLTDATVRRTHGPAWGDYAPAIARWETLTRPAPAPTMLSNKGNPQLSPAFSEWLMGVPAGWITDVPNITRNEALKLCGNGVVPQQAAEALRWIFATLAAERGAA